MSDVSNVAGAGERDGAYADAIIAIARGEGALDVVEDELLRVAREISGNRDLYDVLADQQLPMGRRLQVVNEILGSAHDATRTAVAMVVSAGRVSALEEIATLVAEEAAGERGRELAEVWVARELDDRQRQRLKQALEDVTGKELELKVYVDESVVGGVRAKVGDTVIDGSLARRIDQLKARVGA